MCQEEEGICFKVRAGCEGDAYMVRSEMYIRSRFRLQGMPPSTRDATDYKGCHQLKKMPPTTRDASDYKRCLRLQEMPAATNYSTDYKSCLRLQEMSSTTIIKP